jgi:hypothetical protein
MKQQVSNEAAVIEKVVPDTHTHTMQHATN